MMDNVVIERGIFGVAGAGKTTSLINLAQTENKTFCFLAFNKAISQEIKARTKDIKNIVEVRTIDSLAFGIVSLRSYQLGEELFKKILYKRFGYNLYDEETEASKEWGKYLKARNSFNPFVMSIQEEDSIVKNCISVEKELEQKKILTFQRTREIANEIMMDDDIDPIDPVDVIVVDEFQDLTRLQGDIISKVAQKIGAKIWVAGDFYQTIYQHLGAEFNYSKKIFDKAKDKTILDTSRRVPKNLELIIKEEMRSFGLDPSVFKTEREGGVYKRISLDSVTNWLFKEVKNGGNDVANNAAILFRTRRRRNAFLKRMRSLGVVIFPYEKPFYHIFEIFESLFAQEFNHIRNTPHLLSIYDSLIPVKEPEEVALNRFNKNRAFAEFINNISEGRAVKEELRNYLVINGGRYIKPTPINFIATTTIHKMKGNERDIIFLDTYIPKVNDLDKVDEGCVRYVGNTRAKKALFVFK